jgi:hypothetical protein
VQGYELARAIEVPKNSPPGFNARKNLEVPDHIVGRIQIAEDRYSVDVILTFVGNRQLGHQPVLYELRTVRATGFREPGSG